MTVCPGRCPRMRVSRSVRPVSIAGTMYWGTVFATPNARLVSRPSEGRMRPKPTGLHCRVEALAYGRWRWSVRDGQREDTATVIMDTDLPANTLAYGEARSQAKAKRKANRAAERLARDYRERAYAQKQGADEWEVRV